MILITGANGQLGTAVIEHLLKLVPAEQIAGLVRNEQKAAGLKAQGIQLRLGDYDDSDALKRAMQGIDKVLLISGGEAENGLEQHYQVIDAAKAAGVSCLAYTGRSLKDREQLANHLMRRHFQTEDYLKASGLNYVLFRNALYMDVLPGFVGKQVFETGIQLPAGEGRVAYALREEMGEAIAKVLTTDTGAERIYQFTGPEASSFADIASALSELSGQAVAYTALEPEDYAARMAERGLPPALIQKIAGFLADIAQGQEATVTEDLEQILGRKPASLQAGLKKLFAL